MPLLAAIFVLFLALPAAAQQPPAPGYITDLAGRCGDPAGIEKVFEIVQLALERYPENEVLLREQVTCFSRLGNISSAIEALETLFAHYPTAENYWRIFDVALVAEEWPDKVVLFEQMIERHQRFQGDRYFSHEVQAKRSMLLHAVGRGDEAKELLHFLRQKAPENYVVKNVESIITQGGLPGMLNKAPVCDLRAPALDSRY